MNASQIANYYTQSQVDGLVGAKRDTIADGDLTIARTNSLQAALDSKQKQNELKAQNTWAVGSFGGLPGVLRRLPRLHGHQGTCLIL